MRIVRSWCILSLASGLSALPLTESMAQQPTLDGLEEVVVTGSFIKRDASFQQSSPVDVLQREELELRAPSTIANFIADLPYNFGSAFSSGRALGNERGAGTVNLRGLGPSATLVLLNSRRMTQLPDSPDNIVDVNGLVPEIMIGRVEVLKDGASALYGTDAVAGVVNFIVRDDFEGFQVSARAAEATYSSQGDRRIEAMWGGAFGGATRVVAGLGVYDQDPMNGMAQAALGQKGFEDDIRFTSALSWPGEFVVPQRNAAGALIAPRTNVVDPLCGSIVSSIPGRPSPPGTLPAAAADAASAVDCRYQFWSDNALQSDIRRYQAFAQITHDFDNSVRLQGDIGYANIETATSYTAGDPLTIATIIPGHNPGNIYYRAVNDAGQPLFAQSSGVSAGYSRDGAEVILPLRDPTTNQVLLAADPTNPAAGIPFYEDIRFSGRPVGSQGGLPTDNALAPGEYAWSRPSVADNDIFRMSVALDGAISENWDWNAATTYSSYKLATNGAMGVALASQLGRALDGFGGPNCDPATGARGQGECQYFNLFGNSTFATAAGDPRANSQAVIDDVLPLMHDTYESSLLVAEGVVSGSLWKLPAGSLGLAAGYQLRRSDLKIDFDLNKNLTNTATGTTQEDFDENRDTHAVFAELNVPLLNSDFGYLELNGAVRYEDSGKGLSTTDPKIGLLFNSANDRLSLRGSWGTSFVAPSLFRTYSVSANNPAANDCLPSLHPICTGERNLRISAQTRGNPDLKPQTSTAFSTGVTFRPWDPFSVSLDYWRFEFEDLITTETVGQLVEQDPDGSLTGRVVRDVTGRLQRVILQYFNAQSVTAAGVDFSLDYRQELGDLGRVNFNIAGSYTDKYDWVLGEGLAPIEGAGMTNDGLPASPNTKLRTNVRGTWSRGNHSFTALVHYYDSLKFTRDPSIKIDSWTPVDINYQYTFSNNVLATDSLSLAIGANNVFAEEAPHVPFPGFQPVIPTLHDARGRMIWARVIANF